MWAQEQHAHTLPCGVCCTPQFRRFGMPCWHQQLLCLLAPFCPLFPRHPSGWMHQAGSRAIKLLSWLSLEVVSSGEESHIYQQANEKVTLEKPSDVRNNNERQKNYLWTLKLFVKMTQWLPLNKSCSLQKETNLLVSVCLVWQTL